MTTPPGGPIVGGCGRMSIPSDRPSAGCRKPGSTAKRAARNGRATESRPRRRQRAWLSRLATASRRQAGGLPSEARLSAATCSFRRGRSVARVLRCCAVLGGAFNLCWSDPPPSPSSHPPSSKSSYHSRLSWRSHDTRRKRQSQQNQCRQRRETKPTHTRQCDQPPLTHHQFSNSHLSRHTPNHECRPAAVERVPPASHCIAQPSVPRDVYTRQQSLRRPPAPRCKRQTARTVLSHTVPAHSQTLSVRNRSISTVTGSESKSSSAPTTSVASRPAASATAYASASEICPSAFTLPASCQSA